MPAARSYTATIESPVGGEYKVDRKFTLGSFCPLPCCMPTVRVFKGDTHIGSVTQVCCPSYLWKFEVDLHMGTEIAEASRHMKFKKCAINGHTCCSTPFCGKCCPEMEFDIFGKDLQKRTDVSLKKVHFGCCFECFSAADQYKFVLPKDKDEAAVFIAAV
jgi:hypothetical protein